MLAVKVTFQGIPNSVPQAGPISGSTDSVPITFSSPSSLLRAEKYSRGKSFPSDAKKLFPPPSRLRLKFNKNPH